MTQPEQPFVIRPLLGFTPELGRLAALLTVTRLVTARDVEGLTIAQLDHLHDADSNSIGALLAHMAAVEAAYQLHTFETRDWTPAERRQWTTALDLGDAARMEINDQPLEHYLDMLCAVRTRTLHELAQRNDEWLYEESPWGSSRANNYFKWFHVMEDEISHRGQIRWLRRRVPRTG